MAGERTQVLRRMRLSIVVVACLTTAGCGRIFGDRCTPGDPAPPPALSPEAAATEWSTDGVPSYHELEVAMDELYQRTRPFQLEPGTADVASLCVPNSECARAAQARIESCPDTIEYEPPSVGVQSFVAVLGTDTTTSTGPGSTAPESTGPGSTGSESTREGANGEPRFLVAHMRSDFWGSNGDGVFDGFLDEDELIVQRWPQDPDLPWRFVSAPVL